MKSIPGDEYFKKSFWCCDDSVLIESSPENVWPWLVQMRTGRAGWYSYDLVDNFGKPSLNYIDQEMQNISKGMKITAANISDFENNKFLTFQFSKFANMTYFLQKNDAGTLLTTRVRVQAPKLMLDLILRPGHWIMQKKQFKELKKRIEKTEV